GKVLPLTRWQEGQINGIQGPNVEFALPRLKPAEWKGFGYEKGDWFDLPQFAPHMYCFRGINARGSAGPHGFGQGCSRPDYAGE
ncbi:MAG: hypothetical protein WBL41_06590, partial [Terracidiphilus sp.]